MSTKPRCTITMTLVERDSETEIRLLIVTPQPLGSESSERENVILEVESPETERTLPNEQLETEVRKQVGDHLDEKQKQHARAENQDHSAGGRRGAGSTDTIVAKRGKLYKWVALFRKEGWRFSYRVVQQLVKDLVDWGSGSH